jgi:hypothetical protein
MAYSAHLDEKLELVVVTAQGNLQSSEVAEMVTRARELSSASGWNILYDMAGASVGDISTGELYWMPRKLPALRHGAGKVRVALLYSPKFEDLARFWENAFRNAGLKAQAFSDRDKALKWLRG